MCLKNFQIEADKHKLSQVIRNFTSNALKFTPEGGTVTVKASIVPNSNARISFSNQLSGRRVISPDSGAIRVEVIDTGHGIAKVNTLIDNTMEIRYDLNVII